ncbi:hypothetical protein CK936_36970, partial [Streptomyces albireticuli]
MSIVQRVAAAATLVVTALGFGCGSASAAGRGEGSTHIYCNNPYNATLVDASGGTAVVRQAQDLLGIGVGGDGSGGSGAGGNGAGG